MYIPKTNLMADREEIVAFMRQFSFGTIISAKNNYPTATHLPFVVSTKADQVVLTSHFARANGHWQEIAENPCLVIFAEPHAYISPKHYDSLMNVPTWNYISVHAYGQATLVSDTEASLAVLEQTILTYDPGYKKQWDSLPLAYKQRMQKGIVAFTVDVHDLQGKKKLSQNKSAEERQRIAADLAESGNGSDATLAQYMKQHLGEL